MGACSTDSDSAGQEADVPATDDQAVDTAASAPASGSASGWYMPAEDTEHERTWMCWPSSPEVWGEDLAGVQDTIALLATTIAGFEAVTMLARADEAVALAERLGPDIEVVEAPVDDLWARDTLPCFLVRETEDGSTELAAGRVEFNGWGDKQIHQGDAQLATLVAERLGLELIDSGVTGEGGGLEVDGEGTVLAAASSWVNDNRNPGRGRDEIETDLLAMLGAERMIWVDGLAGADITDGHIDTLARFVDPETIVIDSPAFDDPEDPWVAVAARTKEQVSAARTADGAAYEVIEMVQPTTTRESGELFLSTYMNFYVCNGAVIAPEFGDPEADADALALLQELFPDREIVQVDIDPLAAGGGGIHCATQQQPATDTGAATSQP